MIFQALMESRIRGELILIDNGFCRYHVRKDGQITIHEIIVNEPFRGTGKKLLEILKMRGSVSKATCIVAKCPGSTSANQWYKHMGFINQGIEHTRTGNWLVVWRLDLK